MLAGLNVGWRDNAIHRFFVLLMMYAIIHRSITGTPVNGYSVLHEKIIV